MVPDTSNVALQRLRDMRNSEAYRQRMQGRPATGVVPPPTSPNFAGRTAVGKLSIDTVQHGNFTVTRMKVAQPIHDAQH